MLFEFTLSTVREDFYDIVPQVREAITSSNITRGIAVIYCPHTTAGITINGNADIDVAYDMILGLGKAFPNYTGFRHVEGDSAAHLKSSIIGTSATVIIDNGKPLLGTWQGIFFCEFDPPRQRKFYVTVI